MSPGTPARAASPAGPKRSTGGFTFAEDPHRAAPDARIIWHAELDPAILAVRARPTVPDDPDALRLDALAPWLTVVPGHGGSEHAVLCDGRHRLRLDVVTGRLSGGQAVALDYLLNGVRSAGPRLLTLRRLLSLCRHRRFAESLFPPDPQMPRLIAILRVGDALAAGASQREIATEMFGDEAVALDWNGRSDALRSRLRRLGREAREMAAGGYRRLLWRGAGEA
jgi:hypothetical protein